MLRNYVVIALRNLLRDKVVTSINIVGLSVAIAVQRHPRPWRARHADRGLESPRG